MRLVIDTNIIISSLISDSIRRSSLMSSDFELMVPEYTYTEIMNHSELIKRKSKLTFEALAEAKDDFTSLSDVVTVACLYFLAQYEGNESLNTDNLK